MREKQFKLYWLDGKMEVVTGHTIADALAKAGYSQGALRALDYYKEIKNEYLYNLLE